MVSIAFGNRERHLRFDIDAMLALEAATGKTTGEVVADLARISFTTLAYALWAGLKHEDPSLTPKLVIKYLQTYEKLAGASLKDLRKAVSDAIDESAWFQQLSAEDTSEEDAGEGEDDDAGNRFPARVAR